MTLSRPKLSSLLTAGVAFAAVLAVLMLINRPPPRSPEGGSLADGATPRETSTDARIRSLQQELRARGDQPQTYAALGAAYMQRLREVGDLDLYRRADLAFSRALESEPRNLDATVGIGTLALARHDFRAALRYGQTARRINPASFAPFAVLVDAQIELGRYAAARHTLQRMIDFKPTLASYARVSYYRELQGDVKGALDAMRLAVSAAPAAGENRSYVLSLLGNLQFDRGKIAAAAGSYRAALAGFPSYPPAETGLARVEAARGRLEPAITRLRGVVQRLPLPDYVVRLGETELAAGLQDAARSDFELVRAQQRLLGASGVNTDAEIALFEADHGSPRRALSLGRRAYGAAPSIRSADALGWALTRAGRPRQGLSYARRALGLGSRDPLFLYHAGIAARGAGEPARAGDYLGRALADNPRFSPLYAPRARRALRGLR